MIGFIWARQSNKYDKAVYSLESQIDACRESARADGVPVTTDREYVVKFSGVDLWAIPELADLQRAIERTTGPKRVYVYAQDRMVRGEEGPEIFWIFYELKRYGADLKIILDPIDLSDFSGQINTLFKGHKAAREPKDIGERTMRGKLKRIREGKVWNHGLEKFGYRRIKEQGIAVFDPEEKAILEDIIERVFAGESAYSIAAHLNAENIAPPWRRRGVQVKGKATKGIWRHGTIIGMLRDPAYKGSGAAMRYKDGAKGNAPASEHIIIPHAYPALLTPDEWDELQVKLSEITAKKSRARNKVVPLVFRGRVICARCGLAMNTISRSYDVEGGERRQTRAYACRRRDDDGQLLCRPWRQITTRYVEEAGWREIVEGFRPEMLEAAAARIAEIPREDPLAGRRATIEDARAKKETQQQNLITRLAEASETAARAILARIEEMTAEIQSLSDQISKINREISTAQQRARQTEGALRGLARFSSQLQEMDFADRRQFVEDWGIRLTWDAEERVLSLDCPILSALADGSVILDDSSSRIGRKYRTG